MPSKLLRKIVLSWCSWERKASDGSRKKFSSPTHSVEHLFIALLECKVVWAPFTKLDFLRISYRTWFHFRVGGEVNSATEALPILHWHRRTKNKKNDRNWNLRICNFMRMVRANDIKWNIFVKAKRFSLHFLSTFIFIPHKSALKLPSGYCRRKIFISPVFAYSQISI